MGIPEGGSQYANPRPVQGDVQSKEGIRTIRHRCPSCGFDGDMVVLHEAPDEGGVVTISSGVLGDPCTAMRLVCPQCDGAPARIEPTSLYAELVRRNALTRGRGEPGSALERRFFRGVYGSIPASE